MKPGKLIFSLPVILLLLVTAGEQNLYSQDWMQDMFGDKAKGDINFFEIREKAQSFFKYEQEEYYSRFFKLNDNPELNYSKIRSYISYKRWEEYWSNHITPEGIPVSPLTEYNEFIKFREGQSKDLTASWVNINRTEAPGGYWGMGRIREIAFHPTDPDIIWLGADQGGIWKTEDNGLTYTPVGDGLPFLRVSSICINPQDPDIIYMAGGGIGTNYWQRAIGVYKTINGGASWNPTAFTFELADAKFIRRLVMSPTDPSVLLVSTGTHTYRTSDGGDSWTPVLTGEAWDIAFHPDGNTVILGKGTRIYRSEDAGLTWTIVSSGGNTGIFKHLTISPLNSDYMAAQLESSDETSIYFSSDKGISWTLQSKVNDTGGTIGFSSNDPETLYRGWTKIFKSTDRGKTWQQKTMWYATSQYDEVHADHFRIEKNPNKPDTLYFCNDGGLYIYDEANDRWTERSKGLIISQYYSLSSSQSDPNVLLSGTQDNGGWYRKSNGTWRTTNGGDAMHTWQHPSITSDGYSSYPGGKIYRTSTAWNYYSSLYNNIQPEPGDGDWNSRFDIDPNNVKRIVTGCFKDVYESTNSGETWKKISTNLTGGYNLHKIRIPEADSRRIYASSGAYFYYTLNSGETWQYSYVPGGNTIKDIEVCDYDADIVWVITSGYTQGSKVFKSTNGGKTWTNISGALPNIPGLCIEHQHGTRENLYIGMTYGIYFRGNGSDTWEFYGHGIPNTEIRDIDIQYETNKLRCATYGRGLFEADLVEAEGIFPRAGYSLEKYIVCKDENIVFENTSENATSFLWTFGDGSTSTLENPVHTYTEEGSYTVRLVSFNEDLSNSYSGEKAIVVKPYINTFRTGAIDRTKAGAGAYHHPGGTGLFFNVHFNSRLESVKVYSSEKGRKTIYINDSSGNEIFSRTVNVTAGGNTITLGAELAPGNDYLITVSEPEGLFYNLDGAAFPYGKDRMVSVTGNSDYSDNRYYFFYDWTVQPLTCDTYELPELEESANIASKRLLVYPNPLSEASRILIKGFDPDDNLTLRIINSKGATVFSTDLNTERNPQLLPSFFGSAYGTIIIELSNNKETVQTQVLRLRNQD